MNILEFLKNGSGIHIKKKNRGKFTKSAKAAGLTVQEHARSVLNNPNATPLQKKRANFARNAAKWHHKDGGLIKAQEGTKLNWLKLGNLLNNSQDLINFGINAFTKLQDKQYNKLLEWKEAYLNSIEPQDFTNLIKQEEEQIKLANPDYNISPVTISYKNNILANQALKSAKDKASKQADMYIAEQMSSDNLDSGNLVTEGLGIIGKYLSNLSKKDSSLKGSTTDFWSNPTISNSLDTNFWSNPTIKNSMKKGYYLNW